MFFGSALLALLLLSVACLRRSARIWWIAAMLLMGQCIYGWYVFIFPASQQWIFILGTLVTALVLSGFFYVMYTSDHQKESP
jgi:hypothetical protein